MSTDILEFYIEKEKRELINTIGSAKYISEEQKESIIDVLELSDKLLQKAADKAHAAGKTGQGKRIDYYKAGTSAAGQKRDTRKVNRRDAEEYYREHGKLSGSFARDFRIKDGKVVPKGNF